MIDPQEVSDIRGIGTVDGDEVKLVSTRGGFHIAIRVSRDGAKPLAAGSHPAIVTYQLEKNLKDRFCSVMQKSERYGGARITDLSKSLGHLVDRDISMMAMSKGESIDVSVNLRGVEIGLFKCEKDTTSSTLSLKEWRLDSHEPEVNSEITKAAARSILSLCRREGLENLDTRKARRI